MHDERPQMTALLVQYDAALAGRNGFGAGENFEYRLWDDLHGRLKDTRYVSLQEGSELIFLATQTDS
jgi:hypothetical protein